MSENLSRHTAEIIAFPIGGRSAMLARTSDTLADLRSRRVVADVSSAAWYHDAAIDEAKRGREH